MNLQVYGKNAVRASLEAGSVKVLYTLSRFENDDLVALARRKNIAVKFVSDNELTNLASSSVHQGYVATCEAVKTYSLEELLGSIPATKKYPLLLILDGIEDPHNLGAILRTCDAVGVDGVIIGKKRSVSLNATVAKVSTGAIHYVKVATVPNLTRAIDVLKKRGYWIVASDGSAKQSYRDIDYRSPIALVVGSEGFGISRLVLQHADFVVKIPMTGHVSCLNASVACAILISEAAAAQSQS